MTESRTEPVVGSRARIELLLEAGGRIHLRATVATLPQVHVAAAVDVRAAEALHPRHIDIGARLRGGVVETEAVGGRKIGVELFADLGAGVQPVGVGAVVEDVRLGAERGQRAALVARLQAAVHVIGDRLCVIGSAVGRNY